MKLLLILFILLFNINTYSKNNIISVNKDSVINFNQELKKFNDSISNEIYPNIFQKDHFKLNKKIIIKNKDNINKLYRLSQINTTTNNQFNNINTYGSISRGVTIGNNQNSVLDSELDLQISGNLSEKVSIKASIQDSNLPLQDNGYSQQLDEFDQIFIELKSDKWKIRGGDIDLKKNNSFFGNFNKRIQGLSFNTNINKSIEIETSGAIVKGKYKRSQINSQNGNQGPYKLIGQNGELYVLIVTGSESVYVNGIKLERGIDKDYTINYNAGEIIFNSKFQIMADMRIEVEYQLSEKNFNSFISYSNIKISNQRFTQNLSFYNESDLKNQSLQQNLSDDQKEILANAGDNDQLMNASSGSISQYNENRILYKKELINGVEIYVYSNNETDELYSVKFSNVGENQGDYILIANNAIENIYEYVSPENGEKQGDYDPQFKLVSPEKLQLIVYNLNFESEKNTQFSLEFASSFKDKNLFSNIDDEDNNGYASKLSYFSENNFRDNIYIQSKINANYINKKFKTIERIYNPEFKRDWDLNEFLISNENQFLINLELELRKKNLGSLSYQVEKLEFENNYEGNRNSLNIKLNEFDNIEILSNSSIMKSENIYGLSEFKRSKNVINYNYGTGWSSISYNYEKKTGNNNLNNTLNSDFGYENFEIKKGFGEIKRSFIEFGYRKKINDSLIGNNLEKVNYSNIYFIDTQIINNGKSKINIYINQNNFFSRQNNNIEKYLNTKLIQSQKILKNMINSDLYFESNHGNMPQQEYTFVEVEPGLGSYKWIDLNANNIQELEEFEIAAFQDEGRYIRVLLPNQIFVKTYQNKFNYSLRINFSRLKNSENIIKKALSNISNQFQYSIDKKSNLEINPKIEINPFKIDEENLLAFNYNMKNVFYINKAKQRHSLILTYSKSEAKNNFSFGSTKSSLDFKRIKIIHKIDNIYLFELIGDRETKSSWSENYNEKNYILNTEKISPKFTYLAGEFNRINFTYKKLKINNSLGNQEFLDQQQFGLSLFLNQKEKRGFISEFNYYRNKFNGNSNSIISYVMMNGLQNGENYTWSFKFQQKLSKLIDINFLYFGRKSQNSETIHNGSIQFKAIF